MWKGRWLISSLLGLYTGGVDFWRTQELYQLEVVAWLGASYVKGFTRERVGENLYI